MRHIPVNYNKTGTSKVGAISKAQNAQDFKKKNLKFDFFSFRKCRIVPKNVKGGTLWALLTYILLQNIKKTRKGDSFETLKNFGKKSHNAEKKSNLLVSSGFVGYGRKVKNERGDPFALISADRTWPYASSFSSFDCKNSGPIRVRL